MFINHKKISEYAFLVSLIIICGDISVNPGPRIRNYCSICKKIVRDSQAGIQCDFCDKWIHAECISLCDEEYLRLRQSDEEWFCNKCKQELQDKLSPRGGQCTNDTENEDLYQTIKDETIGKGISAGHVNIRGLVFN